MEGLRQRCLGECNSAARAVADRRQRCREIRHSRIAQRLCLERHPVRIIPIEGCERVQHSLKSYPLSMGPHSPVPARVEPSVTTHGVGNPLCCGCAANAPALARSKATYSQEFLPCNRGFSGGPLHCHASAWQACAAGQHPDVTSPGTGGVSAPNSSRRMAPADRARVGPAAAWKAPRRSPCRTQSERHRLCSRLLALL